MATTVQQPKTLVDLAKGSHVIIRFADGTPVKASRVTRVGAREITAMRGTMRFAIRTGKEIGGNRYLVPATEEECAAAEQEIERRREEREAAQRREWQARYDALPEQIKLARKLEAFCDENRGEGIAAKLGVELLRQIVERIGE